MAAQTQVLSEPVVEFEPRLPSRVRAEVEPLLTWLYRETADRNIALSRVRVSRWRSAEVPQNRETVVDVWVDAPQPDAIALLMRAGKFLESLPASGTTGPRSGAPIAVDVHWL
jgi:hypothetical protein